MAADGRAPGTQGGSAPVPLLNIANVLTISRLVLVPLFLVALFWGGGQDSTWRLVATAIFVLASITDRVDGELARRRGLVTDFGKIADPIADKALTGSALVALSMLGELGWWVTWVIRHGVIAASRGGKLKTLLQIVAICLYLLPVDPSGGVLRLVLMGAALLVTVVTGVDYAVRAVRLRISGQRAGAS